MQHTMHLLLILRRRRILFIDDHVGQSAICPGTEPRLRLMTRSLLFLNFALWNLLGVIPNGTTGLPLSFVFLMLKFYSITFFTVA
jgi:hypothetical protein